jgi:hypothetical protein
MFNPVQKVSRLSYRRLLIPFILRVKFREHPNSNGHVFLQSRVWETFEYGLVWYTRDLLFLIQFVKQVPKRITYALILDSLGTFLGPLLGPLYDPMAYIGPPPF